ncbi:MAG: type III-B CRISPR module RAMP protein Cmr6 [Thermoprotei archaeon]|nr:MAG: type III-B CRISPR module RAMP protein Cmr6 [Thermoprotei archaeon]
MRLDDLRELVGRVSLSELAQLNVVSWYRIHAIHYLLRKAKGESVRYRRMMQPEEFKRAILEDICGVYVPGSGQLEEVLNRARERMDSIHRALKEAGYVLFDVLTTTSSRLLVGMSDETFGRQVFDVGISWDPCLNLPYIPASSLKGAFRTYLRGRQVSIKGEALEELLGSRRRASYIVFADSYPVAVRGPLLVPEVTTPIYSEVERRVYESKARPVPVVYLAVNEGVTFRIIVGLNKVRASRAGLSPNLLEELENLLTHYLRDALKYGVGAKTTLGYGILE